MPQLCNCVHKLNCFCLGNILFPGSLVLIILFFFFFFLGGLGQGQQGEKVVAAFQSDIHAARRTVFCQLLSELNSFYLTNSQVKRSWGNRRVFR